MIGRRALLGVLAGAVLLACLVPHARAERMQPLGSYQGHYSLVPTLFLKPAVAAGYGITRARDRALLNVSVLDAAGSPVRAELSGTLRNLLEQSQPIDFREVVEGTAIYYLAEVRHTDREVLRFTIDVRTPDGATRRMTFSQTLYWADR